jgi:hypothetical protein
MVFPVFSSAWCDIPRLIVVFSRIRSHEIERIRNRESQRFRLSSLILNCVAYLKYHYKDKNLPNVVMSNVVVNNIFLDRMLRNLNPRKGGTARSLNIFKTRSKLRENFININVLSYVLTITTNWLKTVQMQSPIGNDVRIDQTKASLVAVSQWYENPRVLWIPTLISLGIKRYPRWGYLQH